MDADHRVITFDRHEWLLKSPAHHTEVDKAMTAANTERAQLSSGGVRTSDVEISAHDDLVVVSFEAERPKNPERGAAFPMDEAESADA